MVLEFVNEGLINELDLLTIGDSNKRGDISKIGQYSSGLKYAICGFLRHNILFSIYIGNKKIKFEVCTIKSENIIKEIIYINDKPTSFTLQLGYEWQPWMFIREIYSNCKDENGNYKMIKKEDYTEIPPDNNQTKVIIYIPDELKYITDNWESYFKDSTIPVTEVDTSKGKIKIFNSTSNTLKIYKKGIKVFEDENLISSYEYDCDFVQIDEMRLLRDTYSIRDSIAEAWAKCTNEELIKEFLNKLDNKDTFESLLNFRYQKFNEQWKNNIYNSSNLHEISSKSASIIQGIISSGLIENSTNIEKFELNVSTTSVFVGLDKSIDIGLSFRDSICTNSNIIDELKNTFLKILSKLLNDNIIDVTIINGLIINSKCKIIGDKINNRIIFDSTKNITPDDYWELIKSYYETIGNDDKNIVWKLLYDKIKI